MRKVRKAGHSRTFRRDLERTYRSPLYGGVHGGYHSMWEEHLGWLEQERFSAPKRTRDSADTYWAGAYYDRAYNAIQEVGGKVGDLPRPEVFQSIQDSGQRTQTMQRMLTRLSQTFNPEDKGDDGDGKGKGEQGKGKGEQQDQEGEQEYPIEDASWVHRELEEEEEGEEEFAASSGGGDQTYGKVEDSSLFYAVRYLINKLAEHDDYSETMPFGHERWDVKRVLSAYWDPLQLEEAKRDYARQVDDIYLILDTSGSVSRYANSIAAIAAGAAGIVHLYSGTEARPRMKVMRSTPLRTPNEPFPEWSHQQAVVSVDDSFDEYRRFLEHFVAENRHLYPEWEWEEHSFECDVAWFLKREKPKKGSRILFWGDTMSMYCGAPRLLASLLRPYRPAWLLSHEFADHWTSLQQKNYPAEYLIAHPGRFTVPEWPKLEAVGIPVIENITSAEHIRDMLQTLQMLGGQKQ